MRANDEVGFPVWSGAITRWNRLSPFERMIRVEICKRDGHDFRRTPIGNRMCLRCCAYRED